MSASFHTTDIAFARTTYDDKDFDRVTLEDDPEVAIVSGADGFGVGAALYDCLSCGWLLGLVGRRRHYEAHDDDGGGIGIGGEGSTVVVVDVSSGDDDNDHDDDVRRRFGVIDYLFMLCGCLVG